MEIHPWMLYGPRVVAIPAAPRPQRPSASQNHGGLDVTALTLQIALHVCRSGRLLMVSTAGRRLVRLHVRDRIGPGGGLRGVGYIHIQDDGQVCTTGDLALELAQQIRKQPTVL